MRQRLAPADRRNLRSEGIATIASAGNDGSTAGGNRPACISSVVSVGATTKGDAVATSYSNTPSWLDLLAPASDIHSAVPGSKFRTKSGTSMAVPHVAGAWAVLKQRHQQATVDSVLGSLWRGGLEITDSRTGQRTPRIEVFGGYQQLRTVTVSDVWAGPFQA